MSRVIMVTIVISTLANGASVVAQTSWTLSVDFAQGFDGDTVAEFIGDNVVNPNGVWSYGYYPADGPTNAPDGGFTLYTHNVCCGEAAIGTPLNNWKSNQGPDFDGNINLNFDLENGYDVEAWGPGMSWRPGQLAMMTDVFPADGLWTSSIFTAPKDGTYQFEFEFENRVMNGDASLVYVTKNHSEILFEDEVDGYDGSFDGAFPAVDGSPFADGEFELVMAAGDVVSVAVSPTLDDFIEFQGGLHQVGTELSVTLVEDSGVPEDFDGNGEVGFSDFVMFSNAFNSMEPADLSIYDLNNNGTVDFGDFVQFSNAFGNTAGVASVPESASLSLLGMGVLVLLGCRRRRL